MSCLLCNKPFGEDTITLDCGHTFDKVCLRQDNLTKEASLDPCTCPVCLTPCPPYLSTILINVHIFNGRVQRERIYKIQDWVRKKAYELDEKYGRKHPPNKYTPKPTKESMDEARLMGKQLIQQEKQEQEEELIVQKQAIIEHLEEIILQKQALIEHQQEENEVLMQKQRENEIRIQELIQREQNRAPSKRNPLIF